MSAARRAMGRMRQTLAIILCALSLQAAHGQAASADAARVAREVLSHRAWMTQARQCPSTVMPPSETTEDLRKNICQSMPLSACLAQCRAGDGGACYWLANALEQAQAEAGAQGALYQRACQQGIVSGCTNRAAGMLSEHPNDQPVLACAVETFAKACAVDDPWACTMYAFHLGRGIGVAQNKALAIQVLGKSCKYGDDDPACRYGMGLKAELQGAVQKGSRSK